MPFIAGPSDEYLIESCPQQIIKFLFTEPHAIDKVIGTLESLKIHYGGATSANTLVKDAAVMFVGWAFAVHDDVPMQRISSAIDAFRAIEASQRNAGEKAEEALRKIVSITRESRNAQTNGGFYRPMAWQLGMFEATQGSFNVLWLTRLCQAAGVVTASNERMLDCGKGIIDVLDKHLTDQIALKRLRATFASTSGPDPRRGAGMRG